MPAGFGHHPYFVRPTDPLPQVQIHCEQQFELVDFMAVEAPVPVKPELDFRQLRALDDMERNDLLTDQTNHEDDPCAHLSFPGSDVNVFMVVNRIFKHILLYAPQGKPFFAVEPMTNASDGFNLYADSIPGSGVFVLQPGEETIGHVALIFASED